jgi:hypothetical protein
VRIELCMPNGPKRSDRVRNLSLTTGAGFPGGPFNSSASACLK